MRFTEAFKEITQFSIPILLSSCINVLNSFISMWIIARLGHVAIAASALISSLFSTLFVLASATLYAASILIGQALGKKESEKVGVIVHTALRLATILGVILSVLFIFSDKLLLFFHQSPLLAELAAHYFRGLNIGLLPMFWGVVISQFFIGIGKARFLLYTSLVTASLCPLLTYLFIHSAESDVAAGLWGAGIAASITSWVMLIVMLILIRRMKHQPYALFIRSAQKATQNLTRQILQLGIPMTVQYGVELCALTLATFMIGWVGSSALSAQQIVMQFTTLFLMIPFSISQALAVLVGQRYRQNQLQSVAMLTKTALTLGTVIMLGVGVLYVCAPWLLVHIYISKTINSSSIYLITMFFAIVAVSQIFDCARNILSGTFRGLSRAKEPMWIGIIGLWCIALPLAYVLGFHTSLGAIGIRLGVSIGIIVGAILLFYRYLTQVVPTQKSTLNIINQIVNY